MKKVLVTIAALGLVAGVATAASAVEWQISGKYMVEGAYLSKSEGNGVLPYETPGVSKSSDAYYLHTFEINPSMKVNDKISMYSVVRLAQDNFWGSQYDTVGNKMSESDKNSSVYIHRLYMEYMSPIGKFRIGRTPAGDWGTSFLDFDQRADRIILYPSFLAFGPFSTQFYIQKSTDNQKDHTKTYIDQSDADKDKYVARAFYKTDMVDSGLEYAISHNKNYSSSTTNPAFGLPVNAAGVESDVQQDISPYVKLKIDNFYANGELFYLFGSKDYDHALAPTKADQDYKAWAGMLNIGGKFDKLDVGAMYFYAEGQKLNDNNITTPLGGVGTGDLFEPFYVLTGRHTGILNNTLFNGLTSSASAAGASAAGVYANYAVSDKLTVHGAVGYAKADEKVFYTPAGVLTATQNSSYGWEYDLGMAYKLLDNLTYEAHFGYLDAGDYFKLDGSVDAKNIFVLSHSLTMTF